MSSTEIAILGSYGTTNVGDQAILLSLLKLVHLYCPKTDITVIGPYPEQVAVDYPVRALSSNRSKNIISKIRLFRKAKLLIIGGGGLLQDNRGGSYLTGTISTYVSHAMLAKLCGCPVALIGVSIGPLHQSSSRNLVSALCRVSDLIIARDQESMNLALTAGSKASVTTWMPDLAFCFKSNSEKATSAAPYSDSNSFDNSYCVLSLRPLYKLNNTSHPFGFSKCFVKSMVQFLSWVIDELGLDIVFVPFDSSRDIPVGNYFAGLLGKPGKYHVQDRLLALDNIRDILANAEVTIGMRLHSLILSSAVDTATVPIVYDLKVRNFARQVGLADSLTPEGLTAKMLKEEFIAARIASEHETSERHSEQFCKRIHAVFGEWAGRFCHDN